MTSKFNGALSKTSPSRSWHQFLRVFHCNPLSEVHLVRSVRVSCAGILTYFDQEDYATFSRLNDVPFPDDVSMKWLEEHPSACAWSDASLSLSTSDIPATLLVQGLPKFCNVCRVFSLRNYRLLPRWWSWAVLGDRVALLARYDANDMRDFEDFVWRPLVTPRLWKRTDLASRLFLHLFMSSCIVFPWINYNEGEGSFPTPAWHHVTELSVRLKQFVNLFHPPLFF